MGARNSWMRGAIMFSREFDSFRNVAELSDIREARSGSHVVEIKAKCRGEARSGDSFSGLFVVAE